LEPRSAAVGLAELGDKVVDLDGLVAADGELAHLLETAGGVPVVLRTGLGELVLHELGEDGQDSDGIDLLVVLGEPLPDVVAFQGQRVGEVLGEADVLEC